MSVVLNIFSEFDSSGVQKAKKEFSQLDGAAAKTKFAFKKALIPATAAVAGLGAALFDATKGAIEDAAAQDLLANNLRRATGATEQQIAANEDWISTQGTLLGITDSELRPVLSKLAKATGDVTKAQQYANAAMDIAASTSKPLSVVTDAITKAMGGNLTALGKLAPEYRQMIKDGADFETVMSLIADTTGGAATEAANTAQGQFKRFGIALDETKESIGAALLPAIEAVLPYLTKFGDWAAKHPGIILAVGAAIAVIAASIMAVNLAMALNPFSAIIIGVVAVGAAVVLAYKKFEGFRNVVDAVFSGIKVGFDFVVSYFKTLLTIYKGIFNGIASLWNNSIGKLSFKFPSFVPGFGGKGFDVPNIPMLADGGIVRSATLAVIGEAGPEAVVPLSRAGEFGMGGGNNVTINVNGGDPQAVVAALRTYMRQNGSVPIRVSNIF
jgi:phage-related protein